MNGQIVLSKTNKKQMVEDFIHRVNPYDPPKGEFSVDLRAYAKYVEKNKLTGKDITKEILDMFVKK